ncbi:hypothetical protein [Chenggangzhangella methanolivorans]|uniref:Uncharacterized protein n=1 Tax=Chenggangzhangella methanolivorans TaxID=1437009 RepID=A0A9E6R8Z3_9HYPH|nr:hypothetical protein [Chenggangzhangella methanolivorans]QZO00401.1 hypothetical protein K6K41_01130 [Chenggangzhangella methanolivorans]
MSRLSIAALVLSFAALLLGVAGPALDPAVLREQISFADAAAQRAEPVQPEGERSLHEEAGRWLARKIRERNDRAAQEERTAAPAPVEEPGLFGSSARFVVPIVVLIALSGAALAVVDWLRTRAVRGNLTAAVVAGAAIALPFVWTALATAMAFAGVLIALVIVGAIVG